MTEQQSSYRQIMKATSLFGGVQVINVIISIIRSKFIAVLLGPTGMGIIGLLTSTTAIITNLTNFGLGTSAVKSIATAFGIGDEKKIGIVVSVIRRMVWMTGLLGLITTIIFSSLLSQLTFGNKDYTYAFIWLSSTLLFNQLSSGQLVVLQGMRKLKHLAQANLYGSFLGLLITIPLYYLWGIDGIVPGLIGSSVIALSMSWYFSQKIKLEKPILTSTQTIFEGKEMLQMGFLISVSGLLTIGASYIIRIFISRTAGIEQVGLYNAGFTIINTYVGLVFTAMGTDYYPKLSAVAHDNKLCKNAINQQSEIAILILAPILIIFLVFINWFVILLYSKQFTAINGMIHWAALGMFFKASSWSIGFIYLAKGASKLFFWNELLANIYILGLNLLGYHYLGLTGLGLSFLIGYFLFLIQVFIVSKSQYQFSFDRTFIKIFMVHFCLAISAFLCVKYINQPYNYIIGVFFIGFSGYYSLKELDKKINFRDIISQKKK